MIGNLLQPELVELIRQKNFVQLKEILCEFSVPELAEIFTDLKAEDEAILLRMLPHEMATQVFEYLPLKDQEETLRALGQEQVAQILNDIAPDDRTALLEELPAAATQKLLALLSPEERKIASQLLGYPKESVGRLMSPEYVSIHQNWTVAEVLAYLPQQNAKREYVNQLYVVDEKGRLVDWLALRNMVVSAPSTPITELLEGRNLALHATDDQESAVAAFKKFDVTILPVVDSQGVLLGVLTVDDILDVAEREATEDMQKMGGMEALDGPYLKIGYLQMLKKRAPWLSILFVSEMFTSTAMGYYEGEIEKAAVLAIFLPLILSSGGNSGSQATTLIIRAMALKDVKLRDWWQVLQRELLTGLMLGVTLGSLGFLRILAWQALHLKDYGPHYMLLASTIGFSLIGVVLWGSLIGAMLPILLRFLRLDPATCSAPFVATLVDVTGIVIYFTVAFHILHSTFAGG
jgi:magnesium transporter